MLRFAPRLLTLLLSILMVLLPVCPELHAQMPHSPLHAQITSAGFPPGWSQPPLTPQQLDQLLAPIALYPDPLLAQITTASTSPQQILDVTNWLANNPGLSGPPLSEAAQRMGFDPAFIALTQFPEVLQMMADNIDDYAAIGHEVLTNQAGVSDSIQRLRALAFQAGTLQSNQWQTVTPQQVGTTQFLAIQPTNPQIVYVPIYDPSMVFFRPGPGIMPASLITFGMGFGIGALMVGQPWGWNAWGWNWGRRGIWWNNNPWGGWGPGGWRPASLWWRPRPILWNTRPGFGGNWHFRPPATWRPQRPIYRPRPVRPGTGGRPQFTRPPQQSQRPGNPGPGRPGGNFGPGNRPGGNVGPNRPGGNVGPNRPGGNVGPNRPGGNVGRPGNAGPNRPGGNAPATRPANPPAQRPPQQRPPQQGQRPPQGQQGQRPQGQQGNQNRGQGNRGGGQGNQNRGQGNRGQGNQNRGGGQGNPNRGQGNPNNPPSQNQ
jgi:hypothetical protein